MSEQYKKVTYICTDEKSTKLGEITEEKNRKIKGRMTALCCYM